jgi:hypothetical protein
VTGCVHGCDGTWIDSTDGLIPCPRHALELHDRWAADVARANRTRQHHDATRPTPTPAVLAAMAEARAALRPRTTEART